ncbi:hypothetical protein F5884DRAFT_894535 [Xylogone sp. PMI_703]|nr:hypothetical protein F5884DRAFT_894535 [Xylogone sp. PMI_703]
MMLKFKLTCLATLCRLIVPAVLNPIVVMDPTLVTTVNLAEQKSKQRLKRNRVLRRRRGACEICKQRKVKCDGGRPCSQCQKSSCNCQYISAVGTQRTQSSKRLDSCAPHETSREQAHQSSNTPCANILPSPQRSNAENYTWDDLTPVSPVLSQARTMHSTMDTVLSISNDQIAADTLTTEDLLPELDWENDFETESIMALRDMWETTEITYPSVDMYVETSDDSSDLPDLDRTHSGEFRNSNDQMATLASGLISTSIGGDLTATVRDTISTANNSALFGVDPNTNRLKLSTAQYKELLQILERLKSGNFQTSFYDILRSKPKINHDLCYGRQFAERCVDACYTDPQGIGLFLERKFVECIVHMEADQPSSSPALVALVNTVMAIGSHFLNLENDLDISGEPLYDAPRYFDRALKLRQRLIGDVTIRNLQALLVMAYFARRTGSKLTSELMLYATHCAQSLRLNSQNAICKLYQRQKDQQEAKQTLWFLYSIEKPHCLRERMFSVLDKDFIDHSPPKVSNELGTNWLSIQLQYSNLCASILRRIYGQSPLTKNDSSSTVTIENIKQSLNQWKQELPFRCDFLGLKSESPLISSSERNLRLSYLFKYHEAVIAMCKTRIDLDSDALSLPELDLLRDDDACIESAREILAVSCQTNVSDVLHDWSLYHLVSVATCIIFISIIKNPSKRKDLSYLGMATGFFGRLSLSAEVPFEDVIELSRIAQAAVRDYFEQNRS